MARTAGRLSAFTEDAAAKVSSALAERLRGEADDEKERRERLAALSQRLAAVTEKRRQLSSHMDFYRRSLLKGNPSASSSRFNEALRELRENAARRRSNLEGKIEDKMGDGDSE